MISLVWIGAASAQFVCTSSAQMTTFNMCVSNAMADPLTNKVGFSNPQLACQSLLDSNYSQKQYFKCICDRAKLATNCYTYCPGDATVEVVKQFANQYCEAYENTPDTIKSNGITLPPLPSITIGTTPSTTAKTTQTTQTVGANFASSGQGFERIGMILSAGFMVVAMSIIFDF
jgi:hypothetical protein